MVSIAVPSLPALFTFVPNTTISSVVYTIPPSIFTAPLQLTVNLCSAPNEYEQSNSSVFTASTNDSFTYSADLVGGFANLTIPSTEDPQTVTVALGASSSPQDYTFELGISTSDQPWHVLDQLPLFAYEDSDNTSALLTSPTYPSAILSKVPSYTPLVTLSAGVREDLSNSSCYLRSLERITNITQTTTRRGVVELTRAEGGYINETQRGGRKLQYQLSELAVATNYSVWGLESTDVQVSSPDNAGSRLYARQFFNTKRGRL